MPVADNIKSDIKAARKIRLPWWGVLCLVASALLASWLFDQFGRLELVLPTLNSIVVLGVVVAVKRNLTRRPWFWGTMAIVAALHVPLIFFFPGARSGFSRSRLPPSTRRI
jgi:hypothetical protein